MFEREEISFVYQGDAVGDLPFAWLRVAHLTEYRLRDVIMLDMGGDYSDAIE